MKKTCQIQDPIRQGSARPKAKSRPPSPEAPKAKASPAKARHDRRSAEDRLAELKRRLLEISDLGSAGSVLGWDEATYMPKGGAAARGRQSATLSRIAP